MWVVRPYTEKPPQYLITVVTGEYSRLFIMVRRSACGHKYTVTCTKPANCLFIVAPKILVPMATIVDRFRV